MWSLLGFVAVAQADRLVVGSDYEDLREAVDAALPGDYVVLEPGTWERSGMPGFSLPIYGIEGAGLTVVEGRSTLVTTGVERVRLEGITFHASVDALDLSGTDAVLRRLHVFGSGTGEGISLAGSTADLDAVIVGGFATGLYASGSIVEVDNAVLAENTAHVHVVSGSAVDVQDSIFASGRLATCGSGSLDLSTVVAWDYGSLPACVGFGSGALGFDPEFEEFDGDGDPGDDDYHLAEGSLCIDAGAGTDRDGSAADLGRYGGAWGDFDDEDGDGLDDLWELETGLDPEVSDGSLDEDGDGLDNLGEYLFGTDVFEADTDDDGVDDYDELRAGFDPLDGSDQAPTALVSVSCTLCDGDEAVVLDGSGSSDPVDQPLEYTWTVTVAPPSSSLSGHVVGDRAVIEFLADAPGGFQLQLTVDDGLHTDSATASFTVRAWSPLLVPQDVGTLEQALEHAYDGLVISLDRGGFSAPVDPVTHKVVIRGQGQGLTTINGQLSVDSSVFFMHDLTVDAAGTALTYTGSQLMMLARVRLVGSDRALEVLSSDAVVVGSILEGGDWGLAMPAGGALRLYDSAVFSDDVGMSLIASRGRSEVRDSAIVGEGKGLYADTFTVDLAHATVVGPTAIDLGNAAANLVADHLLVSGNESLVCRGGETELSFVLSRGTWGGACSEPAFWTEVGFLDLDEDYRPAEGSRASEAADPTDDEVDSVGAYGRGRGPGWDPGVSDPDADADADGLPALIEAWLGSLDSSSDSDGDGVRDWAEVLEGTDPSEPGDHMPTAWGPAVRGAVGHTVVVKLAVEDDPDGDIHQITWDNGDTGPWTAVDLLEPGLQTVGYTIASGLGEARGAVTVIAEERIAVRYEIQAEANGADDHAVLVLGEGTWIEDVDLGDRPLRIEGAGPGTVIEGSLTAYSPDSEVSDLRLVGGSHQLRGRVERVDVWDAGALWLRDPDVTNLLVDGGDLRVTGKAGRLHQVTVDGDWVGPALELDRNVVTGAVVPGNIRSGMWPSSGFWRGTPSSFLVHASASDESVLHPVPWGNLWNSGPAESGLSDVDGSRNDPGYTGGPLAAPVDVDRDGMDDAWEAIHGVAAPDEDVDSDGLTNAEEYQRGTDPNDWDSDDDRLADGADPDPLISDPGNFGLVLSVEDRHPEAGDPTRLVGLLSDPARHAASWTWSTVGDEVEMQTEGATATVVLEEGQQVEVTLSATLSDGAQLSDSATLSPRIYRSVGENADLQSAIDEAEPGTWLMLAADRYKGPYYIDKDLAIVGTEGAAACGLDLPSAQPGLTVRAGAHVLLRGLTVWGEGNAADFVVDRGSLDLEQSLVYGGEVLVEGTSAQVRLSNSAVLGPDALLRGRNTLLSTRFCVLGWADVEGDAGLAGRGHELRMESSVLGWDWTYKDLDGCSTRCPVTASNSFVVDLGDVGAEEWTRWGDGVEGDTVWFGEPGFLLSPTDVEEKSADLRLARGAPAIDLGMAGEVDVDGSRADIGIFGGPLGDWVDVDNDRDGYTNVQGDCDDFDPDVTPDPFRPEVCGEEQACGCASRSRGLPPPAWLLPLLMLRRRRSG